jgi:hypothetical protein
VADEREMAEDRAIQMRAAADYDDIEELLTRTRRVLLAAVYELTPMNWYESPSTIAVLDRVKSVLPRRDLRKLTAWLAERSKS